jgi:very-short-patch-repair endonuclease
VKHIAQDLRRNQTDAERLLWARLRDRQFHGFKFRRQTALGPYIVDFACLEPKLVIEVDGGQHAEQAPKDAARTGYLEALGYRVIRFWNDEVLRDPDAVLEEIGRGLIEIPSPCPLPEGEGKKEIALPEGEGRKAEGFPAERGGENGGYPVESGKGKENRGVSYERRSRPTGPANLPEA